AIPVDTIVDRCFLPLIENACGERRNAILKGSEVLPLRIERAVCDRRTVNEHGREQCRSSENDAADGEQNAAQHAPSPTHDHKYGRCRRAAATPSPSEYGYGALAALRRGMLEPLVLAALDGENLYAGEIAQILREVEFPMQDGTLHPLLNRL